MGQLFALLIGMQCSLSIHSLREELNTDSRKTNRSPELFRATYAELRLIP